MIMTVNQANSCTGLPLLHYSALRAVHAVLLLWARRAYIAFTLGACGHVYRL